MRNLTIALVRCGQHEQAVDKESAYKKWAAGSQLTHIGRQSMISVIDLLKIRFGFNNCRTFGFSGFVRSREAAYTMMQNLEIRFSEFGRHLHFDRAFGSSFPEIWRNNDVSSENPIRSVFALNLQLVMIDGESFVEAVRKMALEASRKGEDKLIIVSHGGPIDAGIMFAKMQCGNWQKEEDININGIDYGGVAIVNCEFDSSFSSYFHMVRIEELDMAKERSGS
jgi:broad specificity phosphatase PhoE